MFLDGDLVCSLMPVPKILMEMLDKVGAGKIEHEGNGT